MQTFLETIIPTVLIINSILLIISLFRSRKQIIEHIDKIPKKTIICITIITLLALGLRLAYAPKYHIMYLDEFMYIDAARTFLETGNFGDYHKSFGWPFIISLFYTIGPVNNHIPIYVSLIFGSLTVIPLFLISFLVTRNREVSLVASFFFSLFAPHILWSGTAESNVISLFFVTISVLVSFLYFKGDHFLWVSIFCISFTTWIRPENYFLIPFFLIGAILYKKKAKNVFVPFVILVLMTAPGIIQSLSYHTSANWVASDTDGTRGGQNFGVSNLLHNSDKFGIFFFNDYFHPLLFTFLYLVGLVYLSYKKPRESLALLVWVLLLWFVYFFSWFETLGGGTSVSVKSRYFFAFYPAILIWFGYSITLIEKGIRQLSKGLSRYTFILVTSILSVLFIPYSIDSHFLLESPFHKLESDLPSFTVEQVPENCRIVTVHPLILSSTIDREITGIQEFIGSDKREGCTLFLEDMFCYTDPLVCRPIREKYDLTVYSSLSLDDVTYTYYRIEK